MQCAELTLAVCFSAVLQAFEEESSPLREIMSPASSLMCSLALRVARDGLGIILDSCEDLQHLRSQRVRSPQGPSVRKVTHSLEGHEVGHGLVKGTKFWPQCWAYRSQVHLSDLWLPLEAEDRVSA